MSTIPMTVLLLGFGTLLGIWVERRMMAKKIDGCADDGFRLSTPRGLYEIKREARWVP